MITVHVGSSDTIVLVLTIRIGFSLAQAFTPRVAHDRFGLFNSPGVHAWVRDVTGFLEPH